MAFCIILCSLLCYSLRRIFLDSGQVCTLPQQTSPHLLCILQKFFTTPICSHFLLRHGIFADRQDRTGGTDRRTGGQEVETGTVVLGRTDRRWRLLRVDNVCTSPTLCPHVYVTLLCLLPAATFLTSPNIPLHTPLPASPIFHRRKLFTFSFSCISMALSSPNMYVSLLSLDIMVHSCYSWWWVPSTISSTGPPAAFLPCLYIYTYLLRFSAAYFYCLHCFCAENLTSALLHCHLPLLLLLKREEKALTEAGRDSVA